MTTLKNVKTTSFLAEGTELEGDLFLTGAIRIDGQFKGSIQCDSVVFVGENGRVDGDITAQGVVSSGVIHGNLNTTHEVILSLPGRFKGKVITRELVLDNGVHFEGQCELLEDAAK
ncbi:MAG: polymer-forming cytoskeletal protein [Deltaproteobacteria bacterium]|nr:polymer-forming cytoskeletal protein [Deltaproteobacteria bacterium]